MYREWPHFRSAMDLFEMVLAKADARIATIGNRDNDVQRWSGEAPSKRSCNQRSSRVHA